MAIKESGAAFPAVCPAGGACRDDRKMINARPNLRPALRASRFFAS